MKYTDNLTIAIPIFERREYFINALESALNQTVKCDVIVVDNASSHNYFEKTCREKNVNYYKNSENIGMFPNWNLCFKYATTDFILLLGDDDILDSKYVEKFINKLNEYPNLDIYFTNFILYKYDTKEVIPHNHTLPFGYMDKCERILEFGVKYKLGYPIITSAIRKSIFTGFYENSQGSNDWLWIYSNAKKLSIYGEKKVMLNYGIHKNQDSKNLLTAAKCKLSIAYLYDVVLKPQIKNTALKQIAERNAISELISFKAITQNKILNEILDSENIYSKYLKNKLKKNLFIRSIFRLPNKLVWFCYKSLRIINIIK